MPPSITAPPGSLIISDFKAKDLMTFPIAVNMPTTMTTSMNTARHFTMARQLPMPQALRQYSLTAPCPAGRAAASCNWKQGCVMKSDQTIFSRSSVVVHQSLVYIGARAENYISRAGEDSAVNIIAVDWVSEAVANQTINVQVLERRWSSEQKQDLETGAYKACLAS